MGVTILQQGEREPGYRVVAPLWKRKESALLIEAVTEHVYKIEMGDVNLFLIASPESLTLVDAGFPGSATVLAEALASLGRDAHDVTDILVTHCHPDHAGGTAEIRQVTGGKVWMHPADGAMVSAGRAFRPYRVTAGIRNRLFARLVIRRSPQGFEPASVDEEVTPGQMIPVAGGIMALGTPGHTEGHLAFIWPGDGGVLFLGDAATHRGRLALPPINEDHSGAIQSLLLIGEQNFDTACFAHGSPIVGNAASVFRSKWSSQR